MKRRFPIRWIDVLVVGSIIAYGGFRAWNRAPKPTPSVFAEAVDLDPLYRTAVQADGRLRSFESHARSFVGGLVTGPRSVDGQSNGFTYLDLMFRSPSYADIDLIYVKNKEVRRQLLDALAHHPRMTPERRDAIMKSGQFSITLLTDPAVIKLLQELGEDLIRTSKVVDGIQTAMAVADPRFLAQSLRLVPAPDGALDKPWLSISDLIETAQAQGNKLPESDTLRPDIPGLDPSKASHLIQSWGAVGSAWQVQNAEAVNREIAKFAGLLQSVAPGSYPSQGRLAMESWYFRTSSMTWVWLLYLASVIPLLMSVIYHWNRARKIGMILFVIAFLAQTASVAIRWYISGRWPNANMFEALTTSAWFGAVGALILERVVRRTPLRNLFALGSAVMSMAALMAAYFLPAQLDSGINNKMAALNDVWLYIHTNVIIWSYAIIGLACVPALLLLRDRWCRVWDSAAISKVRLLVLPAALVVLNYSAFVLLMKAIAPEDYAYGKGYLPAVFGAFCGSLLIVLLEAHAARQRALLAPRDRAVPGGAAALVGGSSSFLSEERPTMNQVFDGATMVLVELAFIMLWTGLVMGAIWADHSWGRPWGWDPKEVFALNTFLIFLVLIHVRLKVRDKAFWTAILAVAGFEVMMFNWIVVNFVISGLHSYA